MDYEQILSRKLRLLFKNDAARAEVIATLDAYGREEHERETSRVRLAILKLAGPDPDEIKKYTDAARQDYRDVLSWAEYPRQSKKGPVPDGPEKQKLVEADRAEYEKWLTT